MIRTTHQLLSTLALSALLITTGHATSLSSAGSEVVVSHAPPSSACKYISGVSGSHEILNATSQDQASLRENATNNLRNNAANLGMNYIQLLQYQIDDGNPVNFLATDNWLSDERLSDDRMPQETVTISGNGYHCPTE